MLKKGDVIKLEKGYEVYIKLPAHFIFSNRTGVFDELSKEDVKIGEPIGGLDTDFLIGEYIVTHTTMDGGGVAMGSDVYDDGHHVFCKKIIDEIGNKKSIEIDFYQTGSFTAMITDIKPIGTAKIQIPKKEEIEYLGVKYTNDKS